MHMHRCMNTRPSSLADLGVYNTAEHPDDRPDRYMHMSNMNMHVIFAQSQVCI